MLGVPSRHDAGHGALQRDGVLIPERSAGSGDDHGTRRRAGDEAGDLPISGFRGCVVVDDARAPPGSKLQVGRRRDEAQVSVAFVLVVRWSELAPVRERLVSLARGGVEVGVDGTAMAEQGH